MQALVADPDVCICVRTGDRQTGDSIVIFLACAVCSRYTGSACPVRDWNAEMSQRRSPPLPTEYCEPCS